MSRAGHGKRIGRIEQRMLTATTRKRNPLAERIEAIKLALDIGTPESWSAVASAQQVTLMQRAALAPEQE
jgi:hypothetical protein